MAVLIGAVIWNCVVNERLVREFRRGMSQINQNNLHTKQARVRSLVSSSGVPPVDSKARVTKRDTSDIPVRGARMSQTTSKRKADVSIPRNS